MAKLSVVHSASNCGSSLLQCLHLLVIVRSYVSDRPSQNMVASKLFWYLQCVSPMALGNPMKISAKGRDPAANGMLWCATQSMYRDNICTRGDRFHLTDNLKKKESVESRHTTSVTQRSQSVAGGAVLAVERVSSGRALVSWGFVKLIRSQNLVRPRAIDRTTRRRRPLRAGKFVRSRVPT